MKQWDKKKLGITAMEDDSDLAMRARIEAEEELLRIKQETEEAIEAKRKADLAKLSPKERATANQEPWINVLDVKVNENDIRNGFFELDWNDYFILELKRNGYGADGDAEEEIVDRWFKDIVFQMLADEGLDTRRGSGYINVVPLDKGKSEVS